MNRKTLVHTCRPVHLVLLTLAFSFAFFVTSTHAGAIHHWSFDDVDVSGADATDVIGGNTATIEDKGNSIKLPPDGDAVFVPEDGAFGGYFREPDNNDQALLSSVVSFADGQPWTVALWINRRGSDVNNPAIISPIGYNIKDKDTSGANREQIRLRRNFDKSLTWVGTSGNTVNGSVNSGVLPVDAWIHIAVVTDGSSVTLYRDGVELALQTSAVTDTSWRINSIGKGKRSGGQSQGADLDEVWVFDEALSAEQVAALMEFNVIDIDSDGDGIFDSEDTCPDSYLSDTVVIDGCDSDVENVLFDDGCTISDIVMACADGARNHGQFIRQASKVTNGMRRYGVISGRDKGEIQSCAAQSSLP